ncbi:MAG: hypothetical protein HQL69_06290 [Magnetococcales bacterium]|nr:hypothetical protein [Magnetococcales bacterium]
MSQHQNIADKTESRIAWLLLLVVFFGLLIFKANLLFQVQNSRHTVVEPDDFYGYMTQAVIWDCRFGQPCPGFDDLKEVLGRTTDDSWVEFYRFRQYHRILYDKTPIYSLSLKLLRYVNSTWDEAFNQLAIVGMVLLQFAVAWLLVVLFGPVPASFGLVLSTPFWFNYFVTPFPWLFSLAFGLGAIATIIHRYNSWLLFWFLSIFAILFHPMGQLTFLAGIFFYIIQFKYYIKAELIRFLAASFLIFIGVVLLGWFLNGFSNQVTNPHISQVSQSIYSGILQNGEVLLLIVKRWANSFGGGVNFLWLFVAGLLVLPAKWRNRSLLVLVIAGLALLASTLLVIPGYIGVLTNRVSLPIIMIICGFLGLVTWHATKNYWEIVDYFRCRAFELSKFRILVATLFFVGAAQSFPFFFAPVPKLANHLVSHLVNRHNYTVNEQQINSIAEHIKDSDRVLFMSEEAFYYYAIQTGFKRRATIVASLDDKLVDYYRNLEGWPPPFISFWNPLRIGRIDLSTGGAFIIKAKNDETFSKRLAIKPAKGRGLPSLLSITTDTGDSCDVELTAKGGWHNIPCVVAATKTVTIKREGESVGDTLAIVGIKVGDSNLNWPWNTDITLIPNSDNPDKSVVFNESDFTSNRFNCPVKVIDDQGSFVVSKRQC